MLNQIERGQPLFEWVRARLIGDDPVKGPGPVPDKALLMSRLVAILPRSTACFVPGKRLRQVSADWARNGISVSTLTNAQKATDVLPVHAEYRRYRPALAAAGVRAYGLIRSTNSSLHAKSVVIDRHSVFVGPFNFDPRSVNLNTEMEFLIDSPCLAGAIGGRRQREGTRQSGQAGSERIGMAGNRRDRRHDGA